jgi:hypothetical protein
MDNELDSKATQSLLSTLGVALLTLGGEAMLTPGGYTSLGGLVLACGFMLLFGGIFWNRLKPRLSVSVTDFLSRVASDPRSWVTIVAAVWLSMVAMQMLTEIRRNNEIVALRNDMHSIADVINRRVLPRRLMKWQIEHMASYLSQFPPQEVTFVVLSKNDEAKIYSDDLQRALMRGGWKVIRGKDEEHDFEGLSLTLRHPPEQNRPAKEDPRNLRADQLLRVAFGLSGVPLRGGGTTADRSVTTDTLFLKIGKRPRHIVDPDNSD